MKNHSILEHRKGGKTNMANVIQNLYQIFKLPASMIVQESNFNEQTQNYELSYTIQQGLKEENIVSIGDNMVFRLLRHIHNDYRNHRDIYSQITRLREKMHFYKRQGMYKNAAILNQAITKKLFVEDIINVFVDKKKSDFHKIRVNGFVCNGEHYSYLCSGSGQIRRNTATFINTKYRDQVVKTLNCGLDEKTKEFVLAKYSAYFALAFSSILWVRTPRVCVIKDFTRIIKNQKVDFIKKNSQGDSYIEEQNMDLELNCADGQGLIDPEFANLWSQDMDLPYTPCSFVARSAFVKGNLVSFDFKGYAKEHNITTIKDKWGQEYDIDDIDVLLSESQFKTHKYYSSWQEYLSYATKGDIPWGVARYSKKQDEEYVLANYQYIQTLTLSDQDIHDLIQPTVKWIHQICSGDILPTLLYAFGPKDEDAIYQSMYRAAQTNAMKAIIKNNNFLKDTYVQRRIYKNITETINRAKIGKIWVHGNYQFMISDPIAQCQSALGLEPVGVLKADEVWSKFWLDRKVDKIDLCRSPMIDFHEHNPCNIINNEEANKWLSHIYSGIIYNTYDTSCYRHSDSDYDGDICLSSDNPYFLKGSHKDHNIITYEKGLAVTQKMTLSNITKTVSKGFGTGVGGFSNCATILYAMAAIFDNPEQQDQYNELMTRIKLLREIVGQEIDRIKGADKPYLPHSWKKYQQIEESDTPEQRLVKFKHNAMVISKKPYFFRYLYPELNQRFKQFESAYNEVSKDMFGIKFKKLLKKENKTQEEINLVRKYQKYSPLITSNCTMNKLCREFENVDFDIKFAKDGQTNQKKQAVSMLPTFDKKYASTYSPEKLEFVRSLYRLYITRKKIKHMNSLVDNQFAEMTADTYNELHSSLLELLIGDIQKQLVDNKMSGDEFLFYCSKLSPTYTSFNWAFAWDVLEDQIISLIPYGKSYCPVRDEEGTEYLGVKYSLKEVSPQLDVSIQKMLNGIFDIYESKDTELLDDLKQDINNNTGNNNNKEVKD